jgi:signal-transduction protein with cAMP-binding, CBS, and nucleotidyltransferase domain
MKVAVEPYQKAIVRRRDGLLPQVSACTMSKFYSAALIRGSRVLCRHHDRGDPMTIREIIRAKGSHVISMWPEYTLGDAIQRCDQNNVSSIVITDHSGHTIGIMTDRLALKALARHGTGAMNHRVTEYMLSPAPTCTLDDSVTEIMYRMTHDRFRHVVVVQNGAVVGIVSIGDLVKAKLRDADLESRILRERALSRLAAE